MVRTHCTPLRNLAQALYGNPLRRRGTVGPLAMATARLHPEGGARGKFSSTYLRMARVVLRHDRTLADQVSKGAITLKRAFRIVRQRRKALPTTRPDAVPQLAGTKSQKLMALAKKYPGGKYHADLDAGVYRIVEAVSVSYVHLKKARWVLRKSPELAAAVLRGETSLHMAWKTIRGEKNATMVQRTSGTRIKTAFASGLPR